MLLGAMFVWLDYGLASGFRAFLAEGDGRSLGASFIVPAVAALVVLPVGTLVDGCGRFVAPIGLPLILEAMVFCSQHVPMMAVDGGCHSAPGFSNIFRAEPLVATNAEGERRPAYGGPAYTARGIAPDPSTRGFESCLL